MICDILECVRRLAGRSSLLPVGHQGAPEHLGRVSPQVLFNSGSVSQWEGVPGSQNGLCTGLGVLAYTHLSIQQTFSGAKA